MSALLDDYHATVGQKHGLERGKRGSKRKHDAVKEREMANKLVKADDLVQAARNALDEREATLDKRESNLNQQLGTAEDKALTAGSQAFEERRKRIHAEKELEDYKRYAEPSSKRPCCVAKRRKPRNWRNKRPSSRTRPDSNGNENGNGKNGRRPKQRQESCRSSNGLAELDGTSRLEILIDVALNQDCESNDSPGARQTARGPSS